MEVDYGVHPRDAELMVLARFPDLASSLSPVGSGDTTVTQRVVFVKQSYGHA